jgi:phosphoribosyl-dephospho-CoA transferase
MDAPQPHDLIWLGDPEAFAAQAALPDWAGAAWLARAPVVVRRDRAPDGRIPIGLRGMLRWQRHAAWLPAAQCAKIVTPTDIASQARWHLHPRRAEIPALRTLARLAPWLDALSCEWGVTGAIGFALASGIDVLHAGSDVDLLLVSAQPLTQAEAQALGALLEAGEEARLDIQVATPYGAFALRERLRTGGRVLLKTDTGPVLCTDPWQPRWACC